MLSIGCCDIEEEQVADVIYAISSKGGVGKNTSYDESWPRLAGHPPMRLLSAFRSQPQACSLNTAA